MQNLRIYTFWLYNNNCVTYMYQMNNECPCLFNTYQITRKPHVLHFKEARTIRIANDYVIQIRLCVIVNLFFIFKLFGGGCCFEDLCLLIFCSFISKRKVRGIYSPKNTHRYKSSIISSIHETFYFKLATLLKGDFDVLIF